jgi:hypothetical protein
MRSTAGFAAFAAATLGVAVLVQTTGGLPSQLAHLYYIPVVGAALVLPLRFSLAVSILAGLLVSPAANLLPESFGVHSLSGPAAPWDLTPEGWVLRPVAFVAISLLASQVLTSRDRRVRAEQAAYEIGLRLADETGMRYRAQARSHALGNELGVLHTIDRMILRGAGEREALEEIARLVVNLTGARYAAIVTPTEDGTAAQVMHGVYGDGTALKPRVFSISEGVSGWALANNCVATTSDVRSDRRYERMRDLAEEVGYRSAVAVPIVLDGKVLGALTAGFPEPREFGDDELATFVRIASQAAIAVANARQRESLERLAHETAVALSDVIESRDAYTAGHCQRLAVYSGMIAEAMGLERQEIAVIRFGAALHDVGKIIVPDAILNKPGKLTPDEFEVMKRHSSDGGRICRRIGFLMKAYPIVYHHHERWDGKGYPDGLKGERIPLAARIVAVADGFDAMTSDRPYRKGMSDEEAVAILRDGAGSQWDPSVVRVFLDVLGHTAARGVQVVRV